MPETKISEPEVKQNTETSVQSNIPSPQKSEDGIKSSISDALSGKPAHKVNEFIEGDRQNNVSRALAQRQNDKLAQKNSENKEGTQEPVATSNNDGDEVASAEPTAPTTVNPDNLEVKGKTVDTEGEVVEVEGVSPQDEPGDGGTEDDEKWFYLGDSTQYKTAEDAIKGITDTQLYLKQVESDRDTIQARLTERDAVIQFYSSLLPQENVKAKVIESYLPEEFRGKTEDDFSDDKELRRFVKASIEAETKFEKELDSQKQRAEADQKEQKRLADEAKKFVQSNITAQAFGAKNPAEATKFKERLSEVILEEGEDKLSVSDAGRLIHELLGEKASQIFFQGAIRDLFTGTTGKPQTSVKSPPKAAPTKTATVSSQVQKTTVTQKPLASTVPNPTPTDNLTAKEKVMIGLKAALGK